MDTPPASAPADADLPGDDPQVVGVDSEEADAVLSALSSDTARAVLEALHEHPDTHSGLAERVDTTIQTVEYHLSNLEEAGLVAADGVTTSEHGQEMTVYAPSDRPLVVFAGEDEADEGLRAALRRILGGVGVLALASAVVDRLLRVPGALDPAVGGGLTPTPDADGGEAGAPTASPPADATPTPPPEATEAPSTGEPPTATDVATQTPTPTETPMAEPASPTPSATPIPDAAADPGALDATVSALPPGVVFFLGGLLGVVLVVALTHRRRLS